MKPHPAYVEPPRVVRSADGSPQRQQQHSVSQHWMVHWRKQLLSWPIESMLALDAWLGRRWPYSCAASACPP
ncbi:hypothetical protein GGI15_003157 [Coemansia interrupta]|uniref:Uncharacterized protein n=1 Tax=Coemansia interrupta TaxID=1126814 RepID=A0A9W8H8W0_9FUNG|nr:hypothetical protein GGI15_003157 [Coemansia interrupta]